MMLLSLLITKDACLLEDSVCGNDLATTLRCYERKMKQERMTDTGQTNKGRTQELLFLSVSWL